MGRTKKKINEPNNKNELSSNNKNLNIKDIEENIVKNEIQDSQNNLDNQINLYDGEIITINDFKKKEKMLYEVLNNFFNQCTLDEVKMIMEIIDGNHLISLRFLDWFVTRFCYLYKLSIPINNSYNKEQYFNINISYKAQLKSFKKRYFDPFRRKKKFNFWFGKHDLNILTTLGQLNFFRWALSFDVIKYAENNYSEINKKMSHVNSYFKKNIIETSSLTISTSDEQNDIDKKNSSDNQTNSSDNFLFEDNNKKLSQDDIDLIMDCNNNKSNNIKENNILIYKKIQKPSKIFNDLKNSQPTYKYPQVSRNICIEF